MRHKQFSQSPVLFCESVSFPRRSGERVLETYHLLFKSFDIQLFSFPVCSLCLAVQLLSPCQGRFAVRFRSSSLWRLAISRSLLVGQTLEESKLR